MATAKEVTAQMREINNIFDNPKAGKLEIRDTHKDRATRIKEVARQEAREGITTSTECNPTFFER